MVFLKVSGLLAVLLCAGKSFAFDQNRMDVVNAQLDVVEANLPRTAARAEIPSNPLISPYFRETRPTKAKFNFDMSTEVSHIRYHEIGLIKETGNMYGINGTLTYRPPKDNELYGKIFDFYRLEGRFSYGEVNYRGFAVNIFTGDTIPLSINGIPDYMVEVRSLIGKDFDFDNISARLSPYFGGGWRSLFDAVGEKGSYSRHIQYLYIPLGMDILKNLLDGWSIDLNAEYDIFIRGFVDSYFGEVGLFDTHNIQTKGYGVRGSFKIIKNGKRFNFFLEPYFRYWHIQTSRVSNLFGFDPDGDGDPGETDGDDGVPVVEPNNTSLEIGTQIGLEF